MIITIDGLGYQLRPYSKGSCWQLYRLVAGRRDSQGASGWRPLECYPSTLESGLLRIAELAARESEACGDLQAALDEVSRLNQLICVAAGGPQPAQ